MSDKIQTLVGIAPKERARLLEVEQKAIALLRALETSMEPNSPVRLLNPMFEDLGKAIGITVEDLRGEK